MSKKSNSGGCFSIVAVAVIIGLVFSGVSSCTHHLFGGGSNRPKTHKIVKKKTTKKSKKLHLALYSQYFEIKKKIPLIKNKTYNVDGFKCTIVKSYQLPLREETGFAYDRHHSAKFDTDCLYRIWIKVQVPAEDNAKLGDPTLDLGHGHVSKSYTGDDEFNLKSHMAEYGNDEYLFGNVVGNKPKIAILHVPVAATKNGQVVKQIDWATKFNLK